MEIRSLTYFSMVAELESLTHAADALGLTQPALGMQIRKLEDYLGVDLIERHSRGVRLTEAGRELAKHAKKLIEGFEEAKADVRRYGKDAVGTVRVGVTPSMGRVIVPRLLEQCADEHPTINLQLIQGFSDMLETALSEKRLDFAMTHRPIDTEQHESLPLYVEQFVLVGAPELFVGMSDPVTPEQLAEMPLALDERSRHMRQRVDAALEARGLVFKDVQEINAINLRRELVIRGRRLSSATRALFQDDISNASLEVRKVDLDCLKIELSLATRRVERMTPAESAIRKLLTTLVDQVIAEGDVGWEMPSAASV